MKRPAVMRHPPVKTMMCTRQSGSAGSSKRSPRANRNVLAAEATIPVPSVDSETPSVGSVPEGATSLRSANRLRLTRPPSPTRKSKSSLQSAKESCFALTNCHCLSGTTIGQTDSPTRRKLNVTVLTEGAPCDMEIDTGSALSIVSWSTIKRLVPRVSKRQLDSHRVHVVGVGWFRITIKDFSSLLRLVVVEGQRPSLLGLDWSDALSLEVTGINCISNAEPEGLVKDFAEVLDGTLGQYTGVPKAELWLCGF
ncbi:Hypothetical predicted protein [Podarcis lilfordi]|uniref:Peptidase A2 domain-containing protein n=1 Tax=Podarcis lilfordi TaxID=74358 RepID=A0AA35LG17_9SAUR|nr:Hypothetical predicted protein [Podarcis lilfordi]